MTTGSNRSAGGFTCALTAQQGGEANDTPPSQNSPSRTASGDACAEIAITSPALRCRSHTTPPRP